MIQFYGRHQDFREEDFEVIIRDYTYKPEILNSLKDQLKDNLRIYLKKAENGGLDFIIDFFPEISEYISDREKSLVIIRVRNRNKDQSNGFSFTFESNEKDQPTGDPDSLGFVYKNRGFTNVNLYLFDPVEASFDSTIFKTMFSVVVAYILPYIYQDYYYKLLAKLNSLLTDAYSTLSLENSLKENRAQLKSFNHMMNHITTYNLEMSKFNLSYFFSLPAKPDSSELANAAFLHASKKLKIMDQYDNLKRQVEALMTSAIQRQTYYTQQLQELEIEQNKLTRNAVKFFGLVITLLEVAAICIELFA